MHQFAVHMHTHTHCSMGEKNFTSKFKLCIFCRFDIAQLLDAVAIYRWIDKCYKLSSVKNQIYASILECTRCWKSLLFNFYSMHEWILFHLRQNIRAHTTMYTVEGCTLIHNRIGQVEPVWTATNFTRIEREKK